MSNYTETKKQRLKIIKPEPKPYIKTVILLTSVISATLFGLAAPGLLGSETGLDYLKVGVATVGAAVLSWGVNTLALEKAAPLGAVGNKAAGLAGFAAITLVGTGLFLSTYAGFTRQEVTELRLGEFGEQLTIHVGKTYKQALIADRIIPVIRSNISDRERNLTCEIRSSCISKRGKGGDGTVAEELRSEIKRANTVAGEIERGQNDLKTRLRRANEKLAEFRKILSQREKPIGDRQVLLQQIVAETFQLISSIKEASPQGLIRAYMSELGSGISVANRPVATRNINTTLRRYADRMRSVLDETDTVELATPVYPARTGVGETLHWKWLSYFFPIAIFVAALELAWPLLVYSTRLWVLGYNVGRVDDTPPQKPEPGAFDPLIETLPIVDNGDDQHNPSHKPQRIERDRSRRSPYRGGKKSQPHLNGGRHAE